MSYLSDLAADNQGENAPPVSVLSLFFLYFASRFRLVSVSLSAPEMLTFVNFSISCFSIVSLQFFLVLS